jgi:NADPH:quinone reductase-like Zn-dependent oxidoreductase
MAGASVLVTSSSDEKLSRAMALGATDGVNYRTTPDWDRWAIDATHGRGVDHVVEVGGAATLNRSVNAVRYQGDISLIGVLTGGSGDVRTIDILVKQVRVLGIYIGSRETFETMNRAIELHRLRPIVDQVFPFDRAVDAFCYLDSGRHFGKVVIRIAAS